VTDLRLLAIDILNRDTHQPLGTVIGNAGGSPHERTSQAVRTLFFAAHVVCSGSRSASLPRACPRDLMPRIDILVVLAETITTSPRLWSCFTGLGTPHQCSTDGHECGVDGRAPGRKRDVEVSVSRRNRGGELVL